ncbi:MAG TPA: NAD(P)-dependent alcohol dehydrogenase [Polyangiaceae bacterium]
MRVVRLTKFGLDGLALEEATDPAPGAGEVLLRVRAVSLNYRDVLIARGQYDSRYKLPLVPCSDAACEVVAVGDGVTDVRAGERVSPIFSRGWHDGPPTRETPRRALGGPNDGTLAELIVAAAGDVAKVPAYLDDAEAATLYCAGLTAYRALFELSATNERTRVLVLGTGGVSTFAVSLARAAGADVTVVSRDAGKLERALALGATRGFCSTDVPNWGVPVRDATNGGVEQVIDVAGGSTLAEALHAVRPGGTISLIGASAGGRGAASATPSLLPAVMREVRLQGVLVGPKSSFVAFAGALERWRLRPVIDAKFPLSNARAAFERLANESPFGKVVVTL